MNYRIFQGNPKSYKFNSSIKDDVLNVWNVKAHFDRIKQGDKAIIWITGPKGGCYGLVNILSEPAVLGIAEDYHQWDIRDKDGRRHQNEDKAVEKVKIKMIRNRFDDPISKDRIPATTGMLEKLKKGIRGTNFMSSKEEFEIILDLIERHQL